MLNCVPKAAAAAAVQTSRCSHVPQKYREITKDFSTTSKVLKQVWEVEGFTEYLEEPYVSKSASLFKRLGQWVVFSNSDFLLETL